jgi:CARDB
VCALALFAAAPAAARKRPRPKPDLKITVLETQLGSPAYAVVGTDGVLEPIEVHVVTKNQGDGTAGPSTTVVYFQDSSRHHFKKRIDVPKLKGHRRFDRTVEITGAKPALGFAIMGAQADNGDAVKESDESNNLRRGLDFAIVAKEWDAKSFDTITKSVFSSDTTFIRGGFRFVLSRYDHASGTWLYKPYGSVTDQADESGICSGASNVTRSHNPWPDSYLEISRDLGGYDALVQPSASETYSVTITCLGVGSHTEPHKFQPLETFVGEKMQPAMKPSWQQLDDSTTDTVLHTTWTWDFRAALG